MTTQAVVLETESTPSAAGRGALVLRRFLRSKQGLLGITILVLMLVGAFVMPHVYRWDYQETDPLAFLQPPSGQHWFGTTQIGQDVFAQTMRGLQKSIIIGVLVAIFTTLVAAIVGAVSGFLGGWSDRVLSWITEALLVVPSFLIIAICSPWFRNKAWILLVLLLTAFSWMITSRMVRSMTLSLRQRDYIRAARYMGASNTTIIARHIIPSMASILIVDMTLNVGVAIVTESSLSFFGFGIQPPDISLGTLIAAGTSSALTYPWLFLFCCGALVLIVLAVNLIGDAMRDALDPTSTRNQSREGKRRTFFRKSPKPTNSPEQVTA